MFDVKQLETSKIIFNHVPKAGGSSLYFFFQDLLGPEKVFRSKTRNVDTEIKMEDLSAEDKEKHSIFQGHFNYGHHKLFEQPCLYFGIIRDPIERIVSNYYYLRKKGLGEARKYAMSVTLEEYFEGRIKESETSIGHTQTKFLTGQISPEKAREIIQNDYFLACTTRQLDGCQRLLAQIYKKKIPTLKRNVTASDEKSGDTMDLLKSKYRDLFDTDYATMRFARDFFLERRDDIRKQLGARDLIEGPAQAKKAKAAGGPKKAGAEAGPKKAQAGAAAKKAAGGPAGKKAGAGPAANKKAGATAAKAGPGPKKAVGQNRGPGAKKAGPGGQKRTATQGPANKAAGVKKGKPELKVVG